jgi:hypothetical protein
MFCRHCGMRQPNHSLKCALFASHSAVKPDENGKLPAYAWPGGYQITYLTRDGLEICPDCANQEDASDPVTDGDVYWEGPAITCDDCGKEIESAYGDPAGDTDEENG